MIRPPACTPEASSYRGWLSYKRLSSQLGCSPHDSILPVVARSLDSCWHSPYLFIASQVLRHRRPTGRHGEDAGMVPPGAHDTPSCRVSRRPIVSQRRLLVTICSLCSLVLHAVAAAWTSVSCATVRVQGMLGSAQTLLWTIYCPQVPTAPDTLAAIPLSDDDPFILKASPSVYFVGNQPSYATRMVEGVLAVFSELSHNVRWPCTWQLADLASLSRRVLKLYFADRDGRHIHLMAKCCPNCRAGGPGGAAHRAARVPEDGHRCAGGPDHPGAAAAAF